MDPETRDKLKEAAQRRGNCPRCGASSFIPATAEQVGGMPGIPYMMCPGCGYSQAQVKRGRARRKGRKTL